MDISENSSALTTEIKISVLVNLFWVNKKFIILLTSIFAIFSVLFALSLKPVFTSTIVLKSVQENTPTIGAGLGMLSGLANVQGSLGLNPDEEAILAMKHAISKDFFQVIFKDKDFQKNLMAYDEYNPSSQTNLYDENLYDSKKNKWLVEPIFLVAHKKFTTEHMKIYQEKVGGFVNITVDHQSPIIAAKWAELIYVELNAYMKKITESTTQDAVNYLKSELNSTSSTELKKVLAAALDAKIQKLMYANISDDFIFSVVDSAYIPIERARPSRSFICIIITSLGLFLSCLIVFILDQFNLRIQVKYPFYNKIDSLNL
jgi:hypothetical protein